MTNLVLHRFVSISMLIYGSLKFLYMFVCNYLLMVVELMVCHYHYMSKLCILLWVWGHYSCIFSMKKKWWYCKWSLSMVGVTCIISGDKEPQFICRWFDHAVFISHFSNYYTGVWPHVDRFLFGVWCLCIYVVAIL